MRKTITNNVIYYLSLFTIVSVFGYLFSIFVTNSFRGLDFTDESSYILSMMHPEQILRADRLYWHYMHILLKLSGNSIGILRIVGIMILISVSGWFAESFYRYLYYSQKWDPSNRHRFFIIIISLNCAMLYYSAFWIPTPSYNWMALVAILLVGSGLLRIVNSEGKLSLAANAFCLGLGGFIAFVSKPTTACLLVE